MQLCLFEIHRVFVLFQEMLAWAGCLNSDVVVIVVSVAVAVSVAVSVAFLSLSVRSNIAPLLCCGQFSTSQAYLTTPTWHWPWQLPRWRGVDGGGSGGAPPARPIPSLTWV